MRVFALFNLKPGVSTEDYLAFARERDLPVVNALASVAGFRVFRATGLLGSEAPAPYSYIETLDIPDMDAFGADVATPAMQAIAAQFQAMADVVFVTTEEITA